MPHNSCYRRRQDVEYQRANTQGTGAAVAERYRDGTASEKGRILDEFVALTGYHRKHAIRILNGDPPKLPGRRGRRCLYEQAVTEALVVLWEASDRVCGKRLKALLPILVPALERHGANPLHHELDARDPTRNSGRANAPMPCSLRLNSGPWNSRRSVAPSANIQYIGIRTMR